MTGGTIHRSTAMALQFWGKKGDRNVLYTERFVKEDADKKRKFVDIKGVRFYSAQKSCYIAGLAVALNYRLHPDTGDTLSVVLKPMDPTAAELLGVERWWALDKCAEKRAERKNTATQG